MSVHQPALMSACVPVALLCALAGLGTAQTTGRQMAGMPMPPASAPVKLLLNATQARVVAVPPGITETSVFVTLSNPGAKPVVLTAARTSLAAHAMLMQTVRDAQGLTGMKATLSLTVPAHGTLVLDDLGPHVMLMGLKRALKPGEVVPIILSDAAGRSVTVRATVQKP